jgi:type 2 lantibiotic biosynthesis protein LanM
VDPERAARRAARWRAQPPFSQDGFLARRLAADGLSPASFLYLLGEPDAGLARRIGASPRWLQELERAFSTPSPEPFPDLPMPPEALPYLAFLHAVRPLLDAGFSRLGQGVRELAAEQAALPFDPETVSALLAAGLPQGLILLFGRTMVVELDLAGREGRLAGETPEARFTSFTESLREPERALAILRQYPVLARQAVEAVDRWVGASLELLRHLRDDAPALRGAFSPDRDPGALVELESGLGDSHRGGRSVAVLTFASGLRLVYKPKPMGVENAFQGLLAWTAEKGFAPAYRLLRVVDGGADSPGHGWVEWIESAPCTAAEELVRFYRRQGGYLALFYLLAATDFHHENLIAAGEHPVLVDLEALFHPWVDEVTREPGEELMGRPIFASVLQSGMLPARSWGGEGDDAGVDLSGLAAVAGQRSPPALMGEAAGTDAMRFVRRTVEIPPGKSRPTLGGAEVALCDYVEPLVDGFTDMCRLLAANRAELAAPGGPLDAFADAEVRVILRMTRTYATLFMESQHPFLLGDAVDRDRLFDRLWEAVEERPRLGTLVPAERRDLLSGDVPMFTARPGSRDLWTGGGERLPGFLPVSGLEEAWARLGRLGEDDLRRQAWIIRNSVEAVVLRNPDHAPPEFAEAEVAPSRDEILDAARAVGRRLEELALRAPGEAHWLSAQGYGQGAGWSLALSGLDLHLGMPGIVLFLAYLGETTGERRWTELARDGAATLRWRASLLPRQLDSVGAFSGWGGPIYAFTHLAALWDEPALLDAAEEIVAFLPDLIDADTSSDVVAGAAGCLVCLLRLWEQRPAAATLEAAVRCGERILARAVPAGPGIGWVLEIAGPTPLAGMSHGAAGIAWALLQLAAATGDERFRRAALDGLAYERSLYTPERRNWPDLRSGGLGPGGEPHFMSAWCHGAPGVALARLDGLRHLDDAVVREEIATALETTLAEGFGRGHCQCHGDLGNLDALLLAQERLGIDLAPRIGRLLGGTLADIRAYGLRFGLPGRTEPPGFMIGLAGIGYGLLRQIEPRRVPSVLVLAPPPSRAAVPEVSPSEVIS